MGAGRGLLGGEFSVKVSSVGVESLTHSRCVNSYSRNVCYDRALSSVKLPDIVESMSLRMDDCVCCTSIITAVQTK